MHTKMNKKDQDATMKRLKNSTNKYKNLFSYKFIAEVGWTKRFDVRLSPIAKANAGKIIHCKDKTKDFPT